MWCDHKSIALKTTLKTWRPEKERKKDLGEEFGRSKGQHMPGKKKRERKAKQGTEIFYRPENPPPPIHTHFRRIAF